jgi:acyl-CoA synthetase (NDP forming)
MPGSGLNATFARTAFPPGRIGFSSQSGALGLAVLEAASARGIGLSAFVSLGNKADVSSNDLLEWWEDDAATDVVLLYVESFGNPRKFARVARRVALRKPVLALKAGRSRAGARAAGSHTAALAASDTAVAALFRQAGVTRADTLEELLDTAALLSSQPLPNGRAVAVLTNAGGLGILCADACEGLALALPALAEETRARLAGLLPGEASLANPVDMLGSATAATYGACLPVLLDDPGIDAVVVLFVPPAVADVGAVSEAIGAAAAGASKPVLACLLSAEIRRSAGPVPVFAFPESAPRALAKAVERAEWLRRPAGVVPALPDVDEDRAAGVVERALAAADDGWLDPAAARELLVAYGIPLVAERLATTADAAAAAARELGLPVVVKLAEAGVHKTERGGVALDLRSETAVREATARMDAPVLVQPMVGDGVELIAGLVQDASFGPLVVLGAGGVLAELIGEAGFRLAPLTDVDAEELVLDGKVGRLVRGFRGTPPRDAGALVELLLRLGRLGHDRPEVAELDLNPVMALSRGCVAVDARVRVAVPERRATAKTW